MKHLLSIDDLSTDEIEALFATAADMHDVQSREVKKLPALRGRTVVNMFFEDSTRTRSSFEIAGKWLSADVINVSAKGSSTSKGESLRDTVLTVCAMGVDGLVIRHPASGAAVQVSEWVDASWSTPATACTSTRPRPCSTPTRSSGGSARSRAATSRSSAT